jgi:putative transport protein
VDLPIEPSLALQRGDVLSVTGPSANVERLGERLGHLERALVETDLLTLALGIVVGIALGTFSVTIAGVSVGLGTAGGLLTTGLLIGYLRSLRPTFGRIPNAARWVFMELGLQMFMAGVGVSAGSGILETLRSVGPSLVLCGIVVTVAPVITGWLVGSLILRLNPAVLLGAITGAMTSGAALSIVNAEARSSVPALGYTGAYAFANVILTIAGTLIVRL